MLAHGFNQLVIKKQWRITPKNRDVEAIGYDTETQGGLCRLICTPLEFFLPQSFDDILFFLTKKNRRGKIGFFYNLRYDFQSLLKWLPPESWQELWDKGKIKYRINALESDGGGEYTIVYIPSKMLSIQRKAKKKSRKFMFYDIGPFFGRGKLNDVAKKYLGIEKIEIPGFDIADLKLEDFSDDTIIRYCKQDAKLTQDLATYWIKLCQSQGVYPTSFVSTASIAARFYQSKCDIPTINSFLRKDRYKFLEVPWAACSGAFITVFKRGFFETCYEYDINSSYPTRMRNLPDISKGRFIYRKNGIPTDAHIGWLKVKIEIWADDRGFYFPPFPMLRAHLPNYFPFGSFKSIITLAEFKTLSQYFSIKPYGGLYWIPTEDLVFPFRQAIDFVYKVRQENPDPNINYFYKIMLNSLYGKFLQRNQIKDSDSKEFGKFKTGSFFNPCYGSYILAESRIALFLALLEIPVKNIIACFTDSMLLSEPASQFNQGKEMGKWSAKSSGPLLMIGSGVYTMRTETGLKTKLRGFHTTSKIDLFSECEKFKNKTYLELPIRSVMTLASAISQNRPEDMNKILDNIRKIEINFDSKRLWNSNFKKAGDLLSTKIDSQPILKGG